MPAPADAVLTLGEVLRRSAEHLAAKGSETPRLDAELLLAKALGMERIELYMHLDRPLSGEELAAARALVARRARREPVQYVLGEWGFRGLTLTVDPRALIPRPETEIVVERCLALLEACTAPRVLDVGAGSGAIALAIAHERPDARVTAVDVSEDALALAGENAVRTGITLELLHWDLFGGLPPGPWELVVSNPPYVDEGEREELAPEVVSWEPAGALFGAGHTDALVRAAREALAAGGALVLETHGDRAGAVAALLRELGFERVRTTPDLAGRDRVVEGVVPPAAAGAG